jgi:hypothetical protein
MYILPKTRKSGALKQHEWSDATNDENKRSTIVNFSVAVENEGMVEHRLPYIVPVPGKEHETNSLSSS